MTKADVIAERINKLADFKFANVRNQMHQQRVRADVKRHAEEGIGGALIELTVQHTAINLKLKQRVARW